MRSRMNSFFFSKHLLKSRNLFTTFFKENLPLQRLKQKREAKKSERIAQNQKKEKGKSVQDAAPESWCEV